MVKGKPVATWTSEETLSQGTFHTFTVILRTSGCSWFKTSGGCLMCGYNAESLSTIDPDTISEQLDGLEAPKGDTVKIYTSGSFLDPDEVSLKEQTNILCYFKDRGFTRAVVETRPEFVTQGTLDVLKGIGMHIELAIGLESSDDKVRDVCIHKGFTFQQFKAAAKLARENGLGIRSYLLFKPPFMNESSAISDLARSLKDAGPFTDVFSINPTNIQKGTMLERDFNRGLFRPPWFWSLFKVLSETADPDIICFPSGAGSPRGIHNCRSCDQNAKEALDEFNRTKDPKVFDSVSCSCKEIWADEVEAEKDTLNLMLHHRSQNRDW